MPRTKNGSLQKVIDLFTSMPNINIDSIEIARVGGRNAWRTRVSEARKIFRAMGKDIINSQRKAPEGYVISEYCLVTV